MLIKKEGARGMILGVFAYFLNSYVYIFSACRREKEGAEKRKRESKRERLEGRKRE